MKMSFLTNLRHAATVSLIALVVISSCTYQVSLKKQETLENLVNRMPAQNSLEEQQIIEALLSYGPSGILQICNKLVPPGEGDDTKVRYALNGLILYISRPGFEKERKMVVKVFIEKLESQQNHEINAFLIRQLQQVGKDESIPILGKFLSDERLCEPATQALITIGIPGAESIFRKNLTVIAGKNKITIIKALGELKSQESVKELKKYATSENLQIRLATLYALANIGDSSTVDILAQASKTTSSYERIKATSYYLLFAQRLSESGNKALCVKICRDLLEDRADPDESHVQAAALTILVKTLRHDALEDLLVVLDNQNKELRKTALELAINIPGEEATEKWILKLDNASPEVQSEIITMLGYRGDKSALSVMKKLIKNDNRNIRLATIPAVVRLGGIETLPTLLVLLKETNQPDEIEAVKQELMRFPSTEISPILIEILPTVSPASQVAILDILTIRRSGIPISLLYSIIDNKEAPDRVRLSALRALEHVASDKDISRLIDILLQTVDPIKQSAIQKVIGAAAQQIPDPDKRAELVLTHLKNSTGKEKTLLIQTAGYIGGAEVFQTILTETKNENKLVKDAAIRVLANWPNVDAIDALLHIANGEKDILYHALALRGCVRIIQTSPLSPDEKIRAYRNILSITRRSDEKKLVLSGLSNVKTTESLEIVTSYLKHDTLSFDAAVAVLRLAYPEQYYREKLSSLDIATVLIKSQVEDSVRLKIEKLFPLEPSLNTPPEGFIALFNGRNLRGWEALTKSRVITDEDMLKHWRVLDETLVSDGIGQNLCSEKKYGNFELLVDWKIEKGGNGGIFLKGSPKIQICDPSINPEGSGGLADNPVGEWNTYRIIMIGEKVTIYLNDQLIISDWEPNTPIYSRGQIELQANNTPIYFRNIYIREIPRSKSRLTYRLFNGKDLTGWQSIGGRKGSWKVEEGTLFTEGEGGGWLSTTEEYDNFMLELDFRVPPGGNSGVFLRAPHSGDPAYTGMEIQVLDDYAEKYNSLRSWQYTGSIYGVQAPLDRVSKKANEWQHMSITCDSPQISILLNGKQIVETNLIKHMDKEERHPGLKRRTGYIGLQNHSTRIEYRNIQITELE